MNILVLTNPTYSDWLNDICEKYMNEHLIFIIDNKHDFDKFRKSLSYETGVSFMYQHKVPKEELVNRFWFNFHPAPLPEYKGRNLCYHAIINREKEFGATLHYMDEDFDTGKIIKVEKFPIHSWDTSETLSERTIDTSKNLFSLYFPMIINGGQFIGKANGSGYYYYKKPIDDFIDIPENEKTRIRAITYGEFYPKINIGGVIYKVVKE